MLGQNPLPPVEPIEAPSRTDDNKLDEILLAVRSMHAQLNEGVQQTPTLLLTGTPSSGPGFLTLETDPRLTFPISEVPSSNIILPVLDPGTKLIIGDDATVVLPPPNEE